MGRAVSVSLQKGGVGKTTLAINLADALAARGHDVLLVDLDQQGNATEGVGLKAAYKADSPHVGDLLTDTDPVDAEAVIREREAFDVLPAHVPLLMSEPSVSGFERMWEQQIRPIREEVGIDLLAIVPNDLSGNNEEKRIITNLEDSPFSAFLPAFSRSDEFEASPGPGIRHRIAFSRAWREGKTLREYDPDNDMLARLDALARIVEEGGVADA
jgi:chromosome partitioning protein